MATTFHFIAWEADGKVLAHAFNYPAENMLDVCGFRYNRRQQKYVGNQSRLARVNRLIDAGFIPARGTNWDDWGVWREGMDAAPLTPREADKLVTPPPTRCRRTLELFA